MSNGGQKEVVATVVSSKVMETSNSKNDSPLNIKKVFQRSKNSISKTKFLPKV